MFQAVARRGIGLQNLTRNFSYSAIYNNKMGKLDGKVAVVTASTDGIGFAIAKKLAVDGAHVVISSRKQSNVNRALSELKAMDLDVSGTVCHVAKKEDRLALIEKAVNENGGIDILVSNAAVNPVVGTLLSTPEDAFDKIMEINVKAAFMLVKETVPHMEKRRKGSIVLVSSIGGLVPFDLLGAYSVSKTALLGMTKAMKNELGKKKIRVNCLAPGVIKTKFSSALWQNDAAAEQIKENTALHRIGEPDDCAGIVSFLASDDASYITGEVMVVSGGMTSRL